MTEDVAELHTKYMRPEYISLIKDFLAKHPEYLHDVDKLKEDLLNVGVSEAELQEALQQFSLPEEEPSDSPKRISPVDKITTIISNFQSKPGVLKRLVEVDIITHVAVGMLLLVPIMIWGLTHFWKTPSADLASMAVPQDGISLPLKAKEQTINSIIIPKVYASSDKIDAKEVFSYPPSDITLSITGTPKKEVYGFFPYWMISQQDKVNLDQLTAITLFGLETDGKGNIITATKDTPDGGWVMWNDPNVDLLIKRAKRKRIRVELTMKAFDNSNIEQLVTSDEAQKVFISNVLHLVNLKSLDGVNLDFEYVGQPSQKVTDGFTRLVTNLHNELKRQIPGSSLTVDTYVNAASIPGLFDVELLSDQVDSLIVMGYDIHTPKGDPGPIAPLDGPVSILGFMQSYLEKVPPEKLILAVPYYGYDWTLKPDGTPTGEVGGTLPYAELAELSKGKSIIWDDTAASPSLKYIDPATKTYHVVYFENIRSLGQKYDFINKKNLKGMGIWALGYDGLNNDLRSLIVEKFAN